LRVLTLSVVPTTAFAIANETEVVHTPLLWLHTWGNRESGDNPFETAVCQTLPKRRPAIGSSRKNKSQKPIQLARRVPSAGFRKSVESHREKIKYLVALN
jgi:hypothetical protein